MKPHPVCIDRDRTIGQLKFHLQEMERAASGIHCQNISFHDALGWVKGCIGIVERQHRVSHDPGTCSWTRSQDRESGMVHYETQCGNAESFFETVKGMEFKRCPFCGDRIVEE